MTSLLSGPDLAALFVKILSNLWKVRHHLMAAAG